MKEHTIGRSRSSAPACSRSITPSEIISDQIARLASAGERAQRRIGDLADAELQGGAVSHEVGDALGDRLRVVVAGADGRGREVLLDLDGEVDEVFGQLAVAERVGHVGVQLGDDEPAAGAHMLDGRRQDVHLDPERDLPVVWRGGVQQRHVGGAQRAEQPGDE